MKYGNMIGVGKTATIYEWDEEKVLKLFNQGYPKQAVEKEFSNAKAIKSFDFAKPRAYKIISDEDRTGIVYDKVKGESLLDWVLRTGDLNGCAVYMANLHKAILKHKINNVPNYKDFLRYYIENLPTYIEMDKGDLSLLLDRLQDGDTLCHGDLHPGNIVISDGQAVVIDFMNVCSGHYLYDVARTVYLVEYTPVPTDVPNREMILYFKKTLSDLYLSLMNVTRDEIHDYITVISAARKVECPDE